MTRKLRDGYNPADLYRTFHLPKSVLFQGREYLIPYYVYGSLSLNFLEETRKFPTGAKFRMISCNT